MGWKPPSLTVYLLELERGIWDKTSNHFWKRKILILSDSSGIYHSVTWDSSTRAEQTPGWITNNFTHFPLCSSPSSLHYDTDYGHSTVIAGPDIYFPDLWTESQDGYESEKLTELKGFHSVLQISQGTGWDTAKQGDCGSNLLQCRLAHERLLHLCPTWMAQ